MGSILWLASYPKSGNTWVRTLLTNYLQDSGTPADINTLIGSPIATSRDLFDEMIGFEASELTDTQIAQLRPTAYRRFTQEWDRPVFIKVHDAWAIGPKGEPIFPSDVTQGVLYILRNPLDVAVSAANHWGVDIATAVKNLCNQTYTMARSNFGLNDQLTQQLLDWSGHVISWIDRSNLPVHALRYEDLQTDATRTFEQTLTFIGWPIDRGRIEKAVRFSAFKELQQQESEKGFSGRPLRSLGFFRRGVVGGWKNVLSSAQVDQIIEVHGPTMERFGYL